MARGNVEIAEGLLQACSRGEIEQALADADPEIVWNPTQEGETRGVDAVRATMERWETAFEELEVTPEETIEVDDRVVVKTHVSGRGRGSGVDVDSRSYMVWTIRDGKVTRMDEFTDRAEALEAVGKPD